MAAVCAARPRASMTCEVMDARLAQAEHRWPSSIDLHHGTACCGWQLLTPDGGVALEGTDFAQLDDHRRLQCVTGFFGPLPALEVAARASPARSGGRIAYAPPLQRQEHR
ncbi:MAG TPA: hypothetical protein PKB14_01735 [Rubrivivax sp.]|nr:hypothetical protein [Rubrivivax sp.]